MYINIRWNINQHGFGTDILEVCKQEPVFISWELWAKIVS